MKKEAKFSQKILSCVHKKRFGITVAIIIVASFLIIAVPFIVNGCSFSLDFLQKSALTAQIISAIFVIAGVVVGVWQYYIASRSYATNLAKERIEKAIKLSEYYKDNVLRYYSAISFIFDQSGASKLIATGDRNKMKDFNQNEKKRVFTAEVLEQIKEINTSASFCKSILMADKIYSLNLNFDALGCEGEIDVETSPQKELMLGSFAADVVAKTLNNLEYFAFCFTHKVADESVVYQSLAPTYIKLVELLYISIAGLNDTKSASTYYTNVTELYLTWRERQKEQEELIENSDVNLVSKGTVLHEG